MFVKTANIDFSIPNYAFAITFSSNCEILAVGIRKEILLYNLQSQKLISEVQCHNIGYALIFSQDNNYLAYLGLNEPQVVIWSIQDLTQIQIVLEAVNPQIMYCDWKFSDNSKELIAVSYSNQVYVWDMITKKQKTQNLPLEVNIKKVTISPKTQYIGCYNYYIPKIYICSYKYKAKSYEKNMKYTQIHQITFSQDGKFLFVTGNGASIEQYFIEQMPHHTFCKMIRKFTWTGHNNCELIDMSPDMQYCAMIDNNCISLSIWQLQTANCLFDKENQDLIFFFKFIDDNQFFIINGRQLILSLYSRQLTN